VSAKVKKYTIIIVLVLLALLLAAKLLGWGPKDNGAVLPSKGKYTAAEQIAAFKGQPMWLLFHSTTCPPCLEMQGILGELAPEFQGEVAFVTIDVNDPENSELVKKFGIRYVPTTFLIDKKGRIFYQEIGVIPTEEMRGKLKELLKVE